MLASMSSRMLLPTRWEEQLVCRPITILSPSIHQSQLGAPCQGGVNSSSLEVFAALALPAEDHSALMCYDPRKGCLADHKLRANSTLRSMRDQHEKTGRQKVLKGVCGAASEVHQGRSARTGMLARAGLAGIGLSRAGRRLVSVQLIPNASGSVRLNLGYVSHIEQSCWNAQEKCQRLRTSAAILPRLRAKVAFPFPKLGS